MHIADGILTLSLIASTSLLGGSGVFYGLKSLNGQNIVKVALITATLFLISLIRIPLGLSSSHLLLNGLGGILLGWGIFPAAFISLCLQMIFLSFGGLTVLMTNTLNIALPGLIAYGIFHFLYSYLGVKKLILCGFICGFLSVFLSLFMMLFELTLSVNELKNTIWMMGVAHLPIMFIEGIITAFILFNLKRVDPDILKTSQSPKKLNISMWIILLMIGIFFPSSSSWAHGLKVLVHQTMNSHEITGIVSFSSGKKARQAHVILKDQNKIPLCANFTNQHGRFKLNCTAPAQGAFLHIITHDGHIIKKEISAPSSSHQDQFPDSKQVHKETISDQALIQQIDRIVSQHTLALQEQIYLYQNKVIFHSILTGLTWIFIIFCFLLWFVRHHNESK